MTIKDELIICKSISIAFALLKKDLHILCGCIIVKANER